MSYAALGRGRGGGGGRHHGGGRGRGGGGRGGWGPGYWDGGGLLVVEDDSTNPCARPELYGSPQAAIKACAAYQASHGLYGVGDTAAVLDGFKAGGWKWALGGALAAVILGKLL